MSIRDKSSMKKFINFLKRIISGNDIPGNILRFTDETISWAREIEDPDLRLEFVQDIIYKNLKSYSELVKFRKELIQKWHKHIPSLNAEIRNEKLKKVLKR